MSLVLNLNELKLLLLQGSYHYVDFGRWFSCLDLIDSHLVFCIDSLALVASALVLALTMFALYFGTEYMFREAFINRLLYLLNMFATSVIFLFFSYDYFLIMIAWECIGLFSLLLVNFYSTRIYTIKAAQKTFVFSRISDMFMFISFLLSLVVFNSTDLSCIFVQIPFLAFHFLFIGTTAYHFLTFFSLSIILSGGIKAAQFFSHVWLPDAMEAPTPASALIHSSTLVVAGIFLIIRFSILFEFTIVTNYVLTLVGAFTLAFGAVTAIFQNDIKKLVAYSTISQIGYLVCGCGFCCYEEVMIYLVIHALNKAFLFVLVGYTVHFFNANTDMRQMGGAYPYSFDMSILLVGACFNLAGLPYSAGFIGKELLVFQVLREDFISLVVRACWMISFFFTPIYMFILVFLVFFGTKKGILSVYRSTWASSFTFNYQTLHNINQVYATSRFKYLRSLVYRFQYTAVTARTTVYLLVFFWCFFFFFGESLLLLILNYNVLTDFIVSGNFAYTKSHLFFQTNSFNAFIGDTLFYFITFLASISFLFLLNLRYTAVYNYTFSATLLDFLSIYIVVYLSLSGIIISLLVLLYLLFRIQSIT